MKIILNLLFLSILISCASRSLEKDYKVVDASHVDIPEWVEDLEEWIEDEDDDDEEDREFRYFTYVTDAKNDKELACEYAKAQSASLIASELNTQIKKEFEQTKYSNSQDESSISEYLNLNLKKKIEGTLIGARVAKTYWEKIRFLKELGAKSDRDAYTCQVLIKISKENLSKSLKRVEKELLAKLKDKTNAQAVFKKLENDL